jgi:hypothetical protein
MAQTARPSESCSALHEFDLSALQKIKIIKGKQPHGTSIDSKQKHHE